MSSRKSLSRSRHLRSTAESSNRGMTSWGMHALAPSRSSLSPLLFDLSTREPPHPRPPSALTSCAVICHATSAGPTVLPVAVSPSPRLPADDVLRCIQPQCRASPGQLLHRGLQGLARIWHEPGRLHSGHGNWARCLAGCEQPASGFRRPAVHVSTFHAMHIMHIYMSMSMHMLSADHVHAWVCVCKGRQFIHGPQP